MNPLNWKEVHTLASLVSPFLVGSQLTRVFVPQRKFAPENHYSGEWVFLFKKQKKELGLVISVRPQKAYFFLETTALSRSEPKAPRSAFDLEVEKTLRGKTLTRVEALPCDRTILYWFDDYALVHSLIPARPNLQLISQAPDGTQTILTDFRSPELRNTPWDSPRQKPSDREFENRLKDLKSSEEYGQTVLKLLEDEQRALRADQARRKSEIEIKNLKKRLTALELSLEKLQTSPPWSHLGDVLKAHLYRNPIPNSKGELFLEDPLTGKTETIPIDPKKSLPEVLKSFYEKAKKTTRQTQDTQNQIQETKKSIQKIESTLMEDPDLLGTAQSPLLEKNEKSKKKSAWEGPLFESESGFQILAGRNEKENQKLTFQVARGNDIWFHVRGKPSAHVVILNEKGKSVDLETLLDAAHVLITYSGGKEWGKVEIDYTPRKNVQRIRGSTKASYRGNKTLLVTFDPTRWEAIRKRSH